METKTLKNSERSIHRKTVNIKYARLLDNVVGIVSLVDIYSYPVGAVGNLCDGVYNKPVMLFAVVGGNNVKTISNAVKCRHIVFICKLAGTLDIVTAKIGGKLIYLLNIVSVHS